ncbi:MAG: hypothetical protein U1A78_34880 [Polyangia bacterium]
MPTYAEKTRSNHRSNPPRQPAVHSASASIDSAAPVAGPTQRATAEQAAPVVSHWAESGRHSTPVKHAAHAQPDPGFAKLISPELPEKEAPRRIGLPVALTQGLQAAWQRSYPGGQPVEQGGNLVQNPDGSFAFRPGEAGTAGDYTPNILDVGKGQRLVGVGHTHGYEREPGSPTNVSLSGEDLAHLLFNGQPFVAVQSNESRFIVARTAELNKKLDSLNYEQVQELSQRVKATWNSVYDSTKGSVAERADAATQATCSAFHMVYYRGKGSILKRVDSHP